MFPGVAPGHSRAGPPRLEWATTKRAFEEMQMEAAVQNPKPEGYSIVPRQGLDFGLDGDIPKYWLGGDAF